MIAYSVDPAGIACGVGGKNRLGSLVWQAFDSSGHSTKLTGEAPGVGVWSFAAPAARRDGGFIVFY